jgi:sodium-dependent dicarboxylate transporter 2/3/5
VNLLVILIIVSFMVNFLTEVTSNVAVATILLPIISSTAIAMGFHPYPLMVAVTISASCAFMLPVATPPNAVVFSTGYVRIGQMARAGFILNIVSVSLVVLAIWYLMPVIWNINPFTVPDFAR